MLLYVYFLFVLLQYYLSFYLSITVVASLKGFNVGPSNDSFAQFGYSVLFFSSCRSMRENCEGTVIKQISYGYMNIKSNM